MNLLVLNKSYLPHYEAKIKAQEYKQDSGLDLICPETIVVEPGTQTKIKLGVKCEPNGKHGFWLLSRSSIYKTPLRLCNSVGLIDYQYRGELMAVVDHIGTSTYTIKEGDVLFQIVMPDLCYFKTRLVNEVSETNRGEGGFGSSGTTVVS